MTVARAEPLPREASWERDLPVRVEELGPGLEGAWDELVAASPGSSPFHLLGWRHAVEKTFGYRPFYLVARRGCRLVGLLPLFETRSPLAGHALVSLPFAIRGGVVAEDDSAAAALVVAARRLAERCGVDYLELRSAKGLDPLRLQLQTRRLYVTFRADLTRGEEYLLRRMDRKRRQMLTRAARDGYEARVEGPAALPEFYRLFCLSMRRHGTPPYPRAFLAEILARLPGNLFFVYRGGRAVAGVLNLLHQGALMPFYAGSASPRPRGADDFMYWSLMRWAREQGCHSFDFGRSRLGTGACDYKRRWGMDEVPLAYQYQLIEGRALPDATPGNPRYAPLLALWRRLPLPVTRWLGAPIIKRLP